MGKIPEVNYRTDAELIDLTKQGDHSAFAEIVRRYKSRIASTIHGMIGRCIEADDIGQEVFIRFYNAIANFRGDSELGTYLTRIAINLSLNEIRRRKRRRFFSLDSLTEKDTNAPDAGDAALANDSKAIVQQAIEKLNVKYSSVLVLRLVDGYSTEETAKILGVPLGTVLSRLARAQIKLKEYLTPFLSEI